VVSRFIRPDATTPQPAWPSAEPFRLF